MELSNKGSFCLRPLGESYLRMALVLGKIKAEFIHNFFRGETSMGPLVEKILISIMRKILNEEVVAKAKVELIAFLRELALKSDNKLDDAMVDIIEEALNAAPAIPA